MSIDAANMLESFDTTDWAVRGDAMLRARALEALEGGKVLFFPKLGFMLEDSERRFLSPEWVDGKSKNVSYKPRTGELRGSRCTGDARRNLTALVARYYDRAQAFMKDLLPRYAPTLEAGRTSFRPVEVTGRPSSYKKDDRRLHVDAFPSQPVQGKRILRIFTNVNPDGRPRVWNVGEPFEPFARAFLPRTSSPWPGSGWLLQRLGITRGRRTGYDALMLQLHDRAKGDERYQQQASKARIAFPPGSSWVVFTDQVLHAALAGQYLFEQTFYLPVHAMQAPERSPLKILERLRGNALV